MFNLKTNAAEEKERERSTPQKSAKKSFENLIFIFVIPK
jgi:hypothetical protein